MSRRALVAGLGLIGGSIGKALRARGWFVAYVDPHVDDPGDAADARGSFEDDYDVTIVATPEDVRLPALRGLVTTTFSVMDVGRVLNPASRTESPAHIHVIPGHPMAGSERSGLAAARADLFVGKRWFLARENEIVQSVIADCGAIADVVDPLEHDRAVAITSHLPQILSTALAAYLDDRRELLRFAGTGLETFLRLAGSDAKIWTPIIEANRAQIAPHADAVLAIVRKILDGDADPFQRAQRLHAALTYHPRP
jgi:prephenate dehydrogenase